jgi:clan AA aspartic protease (TIGR02281 family)
MKINELKEKYEGEWLAIKITKEKKGKAVEGELKDHCNDRKEIWERAKKIKEKGLYITYAGPPLEKGYAAAFSSVEIDATAPLIVLEASIGKDRYKIDMALDTGASYVMLPWYVAEHLNYDVLSTKRRSIITASGTEIVPVINIDEMTVADGNARNVEAICHDMPHESSIQGLIGLSFLRNFRLLIDFKGGYLEMKN